MYLSKSFEIYLDHHSSAVAMSVYGGKKVCMSNPSVN